MASNETNFNFELVLAQDPQDSNAGQGVLDLSIVLPEGYHEPFTVTAALKDSVLFGLLPSKYSAQPLPTFYPLVRRAP